MTDPVMSYKTKHGRFYHAPTRAKDVPSVTNIKDMKAIDALKFAAARDAATFAVEQYEAWSRLPKADAIRLIKGAPFASDPDSPSGIGTTVHGWVEQWVKYHVAPTAEEIKSKHVSAGRMWNQFGKFINEYKPKFIDAEFTVWSDRYDYAGTADLALIVNRQLTLVDVKTGKQPYGDMALQLAALAYADVIIRPNGAEFPMPKWQDFRILHLRPMSYNYIKYENVDKAFPGFLGLRAAFDWKVNWEENTMRFTPPEGTHERRAA